MDVKVKLTLTARVYPAAAHGADRRHAVALVTTVQRQTFNRTQIRTPVDTGNLRSHNRLGALQASATRVTAEVFNDCEYAEAVHDGSRPHTITANRRSRTNPNRPGALKFKIGSRTIYRRSVQHPGSAGRPWLEKAAQEVAAQNGFVFQRT